MEIVPYTEILAAAEAVGLRCVYPNGAAFSPRTTWNTVGWITGEDASLRPAYRDVTEVRSEADLPAATAGALFDSFTASEVWLAPVHHWAAELDHGSDADGGSTRDLFPAALAGKTQADGIRFTDRSTFRRLLAELLPRLWKTDFTVLVPGVSVLVTLHHHRQVWFRFADALHAAALRNQS